MTRPDVCFFGTYDESTHPRVGTLREGLAAVGLDVAVLNAPLGVDTAARVELVRHPGRAFAFAATVGARWCELVAARVSWLVPGRRRRRSPDVVVVGYLGQMDVVLARLCFPRATIVLDLLVGLADTARDRDLDVQGRRGWLGRILGGLDAMSQRIADVVVFDTEEHREHLAVPETDTIVVGVGAPSAYFTESTEVTPLSDRPLRVLFYGLYTPLQGAPVIGAAVARLADDQRIAFTMVGHGQDLDEAKRSAGPDGRVTWIDWLPAGELPALIASHDVCLGIFGTSDKAQRVVPNKVFQGSAAGAVLVTSDTRCQRDVLGDVAVFVPAGDDVALSDALRSLADDPDGLTERSVATARLARDAFHPAAVVVPLVERLWPGRFASR